MKLRNLTASLPLALVMTATLSVLAGCKHENPLLNQESIGFIRDQILLSDREDLIRTCAEYYANLKKLDDKTKCNEWSANAYKNWMKGIKLPNKTQLEDLRDSKFWQAVLAE